MASGSHSAQTYGRHFAWTALAIVCAGLALGVVRVRQEDQHLREDLLQQATLVSWAINAVQVESLTGSEADLDQVLYQRVKDQLVKSRALYPHCRFLYLMTTNAAGQFLFLADSEQPDSENYSPPGQIYDDVTPALREAMEHRVAQVEGPATDDWGTWVSALVPIRHPYSDKVLAVFGMDMDAREWRTAALRPIISTTAFSVLLLLVLAVGWILFNSRLNLLTLPAWRGPQAMLTLMLGLSLTGIAARLADEQEDYQHRKEFQRLTVAHASLIQQAMFRLGDNYLEGLSRFFVGSRFVDRQEFSDYIGYLLNRPYALAWMWIPEVLEPDRAAYEQAVAEGGAPGYHIKDIGFDAELAPAGSRPVYYPVCYMEPIEGRQHILGVDLGSDPERFVALKSAARTRLTTATDPIRLMLSNGGTEILIYRPVYHQNETNRLAGFTSVALNMETFLWRALSRESIHDDFVNRASLYQVREDGSFQWLAANHLPGGAKPALDRPDPFAPSSTLRVVAPAFAFGQVYALASEPGPLFDQLNPDRAAQTKLLAGLLLTLLSSLLVGVITGRRTALERLVSERTTELRNSESSYHGLFNTIRQAIYIMDEKGTFIDVNEGALTMYGYARNELIGRNPSTVAAPGRNDLQENAKQFERAFNGEPQQFEFWGQRKNGEPFPKDVWLYPGVYFGRKIVVAVANDISERKRAERELLDAHERLNTFIEAIPDTVQIKDGEGRWLLINRAAARIFQLEDHTWLGKTDARLGEERPHLRALHGACQLSDQATWTGGITTLHTEAVSTPQGTRLFEVMKLPLLENDGRRKALIAIGRDVTERAQAEEEKARLQAQLQQAQKLESIGRLAGGVAHDFNNMLQAILGNATLALEASPEGQLNDYLIEIKQSAQRSADLTRQLLTFASRQTISPRVIDLNDTVSGMLKMLRRLIGEDIQLLWAPGSELWPVKADPSQIDQLLANLAVNARDAINGVGTITIETANHSCRPDDPLLSDCPDGLPGDYVLLTVRDTGKGMDKETRSHIFEPFYTTKAPGKGVGLGLATVFGIAKQNHGFITVRSEAGQGATFTIGLPRTHLTPTPEVEARSTPMARGRNELLLLVEDEHAILKFGRDGLQRMGYQVLVASTPEEALSVARQAGTELVMLITDVVLPSMNGHELAGQLIQERPGLKCLFMSGYTADIIAHRGVLDEKVNFIQKPFTLATLAAKVRTILDQPSS